MVVTALKDPFVHDSKRLSLLQRARKICLSQDNASKSTQRKKSSAGRIRKSSSASTIDATFKYGIEDFPMMEILEAPEVRKPCSKVMWSSGTWSTVLSYTMLVCSKVTCIKSSGTWSTRLRYAMLVTMSGTMWEVNVIRLVTVIITLSWQVHITGHRLNTAPVYLTSTPLQRSVSRDSDSVDSEASTSSSGQQSHTLLGVEGYAISYYTTEVGWPCALHAEGSCFMTLFALLMWDEIFTSGIPDVFRTKFQVMAIIIYTQK